MSSVCIACGGSLRDYSRYKFKSQVFRTIYRSDRLFECSACGLRQADMALVDAEALDQYYRTQYRTVARIARSDATYIYRPRSAGLAKLASDSVESARRVFEIGAGHCYNLHAIGKAFAGADLVTDEMDESITLPPGIQRGSLRDGPYDLVVMSHVLEHFADPLPMLHAAIEALAPGGAILIEVPNDTPAALAAQRHHEPHLTFFETDTLARTLARSRGKAASVYTVGPTTLAPSLGSRTKDIVRQAAYAVPGLRDYLARKREQRVLDFTTPSSNGRFLRAVLTRRAGERAAA